MMGTLNGIERTPDQFKALAQAAGLRVTKIWECRSQVSIVEMRKIDASDEGGLKVLIYSSVK